MKVCMMVKLGLFQTAHLREGIGGERKVAEDPLRPRVPGAVRPARGAVLEAGIYKQECVLRPVILVKSLRTTYENCPMGTSVWCREDSGSS